MTDDAGGHHRPREDASPHHDPGPAPGTTRSPGSRAVRSQQAALGVFVLLLVVAGPSVLFHFGSYHWFMMDEFLVLADGGSGFPDLAEPHAQSHWIAVPRLIYQGLWTTFGFTTYLPYQACVVALHLAVAALLRTVMRRSGVGPWLATAAAGIIVLFGPGAENIVWAFQVSFTGSMAYGLAHLVLADHDGALGRRDVAGVALGFLSLASSGVGVTMVAVVGLAVLLRRGWMPALFHTVPLALVQGAWVLAAGPALSAPGGRPPLGVLRSWIASAETGTLLGIAHFPALAAVLVVVLVVGIIAMVVPPHREAMADLRHRGAVPIALFVGGFLFAAVTGSGRWYLGVDAARASRYVYLGAAMMLPLLAFAAQAIATRWRVLAPVVVGLFVLPIPFNLSAFEPELLGPRYMDQQQYILTTAVRMPFARSVPRDVRPIPAPYASGVTMGFLLGAERSGRLDASSVELTPSVQNEFRVRLGVAQRSGPVTGTCRTVTGHLDLSPEHGEQFGFRDVVVIRTRTGTQVTSPPVKFRAALGGPRLTIELPDLALRVSPPPGATTFRWCDGP